MKGTFQNSTAHENIQLFQLFQKKKTKLILSSTSLGILCDSFRIFSEEIFGNTVRD